MILKVFDRCHDIIEQDTLRYDCPYSVNAER